MFDHPGSKLKTVAKILFWFNLVLCVFLAFILGIEKTSYGTYVEKEVHFEVFFYLLVLGPISAYLTSLILCGFGELIENSRMTGLLNTVKSINESQKQKLVDPNGQYFDSAPEKMTTEAEPVPEGQVRCPRCNRVQNADRSFCFECGFGGSPFKKEPKA